MKYIKGDATDPIIKVGVRIITHICNDSGGWGSGFVVSLSKRWREPENKYRDLYRVLYKNHTIPLGTVQVVPVNDERNLFVVNMVAQHGYKSGSNPVPLNYDALDKCLNKLNLWINSFVSVESLINLPWDVDPITIHMPRIGCGLAGGSWNKVERIVDRSLQNYDVYVYDL